MNRKQGAALVSILALTSLALVIISSTTVISVINAKINQDQFYSEETYQAVNCLVDEAVLRYIRERDFENPYPDWTGDCLQIVGFDCKMELNLDENGGVVDAWGKIKGKQRHIRADLTFDDEWKIFVNKEEIY